MDAPGLVILCTVLNVSFHAEPALVEDLMKVYLWTLREDADEARRLLQKCASIQVCSSCATEVDDRIRFAHFVVNSWKSDNCSICESEFKNIPDGGKAVFPGNFFSF